MSDPPPTPRRGPRPLALHLMLGAGRSMAALTMPLPSAGASPSSSFGWPRSNPSEAARIGRRLAEGGIAPEAFRAAVLHRLLREDAALARGIAAYRAHPHRRTLPDPPAIWREGAARLFDYSGGGGGGGLPVLFVWGDADRLIAPGELGSVTGNLPAEVVRGRHAWLLTQPEEFAALLRNALVVHAMLERKRRGQAVFLPPGAVLADLLPHERRAASRTPGGGRAARTS